MDISDGTLKGTNNIMARLGVVLAVAAFDVRRFGKTRKSPLFFLSF